MRISDWSSDVCSSDLRRRDRHGPRDVGTLGVGQVIGRALDAAELREDWLSQLAKAFEPVLAERAGLSFPSYRVTCGFPSKGGELGKKKRVRGQCWSAEASDDQHAEISIRSEEHTSELP